MPYPHKLDMRSHKGMVTGLKYYVPTLLVAFSVGMIYGGFSSKRLLVICPAIVAAFFFLSLATLEIADGALRYRRFLKWTTIKGSDVRGGGVAWPGVIGYLRLNRYVYPWRNLYFVLDQPLRWNANSPLLNYLSRGKNSENHGSPLSPEARPSKLRLALLATMGFLTCLTVFYLTPENLLHDGLPKPTTDMPTFLKTLFQISGWFRTLAVQIVCTAVIALLAITRKNRREAWLYSLLSGFALAGIVVRLLS